MAQSIPQTPPQTPDVPVDTPKHKFNPRLVIPAIAAIAVAGYLGWQQFMPQAPATTLPVSGRIDVDETDIQAKNGGQVAAISVREGDRVKVGQVIAQITADDVQAQVRRAEANVNGSRQREAQARADLESARGRRQRAESRVVEIDTKIREAQLNWQQSKGDTSGQIAQATANVAVAKAQQAEAQAQVEQARAQIQQAQSQLALARKNRDRYAQLVAQGAINQQQFDQSQTAVETAQATLDTSKATLTARIAAVRAAADGLNAARGGLTLAQTKKFNPDIRNAQLASFQQQREQALADLQGAQADVNSFLAKQRAAQADIKSNLAQRKEAQANLGYSTLKSPIDGVVLQRQVEPGAVVTPQKTLLTLFDPNAVYMRAYVPEGDIGKVRVGMKARVFLDSNPQQSIAGKVIEIDPNATFTPENIYFRKDRVRQVFGIKIAIEQPQGLAKPGMPVDGEILLPESSQEMKQSQDSK